MRSTRRAIAPIDMTTAAQHLAVPARSSRSVLKTIQKFDPTGVGARTLGECLALQLKERDRLDPAMQALARQSSTAGQARRARR